MVTDMSVILLDPGHGEGYNHSDADPNYAEGTRMWEFSLVLKEKLEEKGFRVYSTRPALSDDPTHYARGVMAGEVGADLFLSLHSNAPTRLPDGSHDQSKRGTVGCYSQKDIAFNRPLTENLTLAVSELMQNKDLGSFYMDYPNRPGIDYYAVLRYAAAAGCPHAIILEHGYHTNPYDCAWLMDDAHLTLLANAEAEVIRRYFMKDEKIKYYRVQTGAYKYLKNAEKTEQRLREKGFDSFITYNNEYYRVQCGAYTSLDYARAKAQKLSAAGFNTYISYSE